MANVKFVNAAGKYQDDTARHDLIHYINQRRKTPNHIVGFSHGDITITADHMTHTARSFGKDHGVRIYHFIITFAPGDVRGLEYVIYAVHEDAQIPHIHFAFNPVSFVDGYKYHGVKQEFHELMDMPRDVIKFIGIYRFFRAKYEPDKENPHE